MKYEWHCVQSMLLSFFLEQHHPTVDVLQYYSTFFCLLGHFTLQLSWLVDGLEVSALSLLLFEKMNVYMIKCEIIYLLLFVYIN